jgi:putative membrane protein
LSPKAPTANQEIAMTAHLVKAISIGLATLGLAMGAIAQKAGDASLPRADVRFMQKAAADGIAEVELGKLAQQKGMRDEVKQFATRMVEDHGKANDQLQKIAASHNVQLPASTDRKHRKAMEKLSKQVGPDFDREYMKLMVKDHRKDVKEFSRHAKSRNPDDVSQFAAATLPTLDSHLQAALATYDIVAASKRSGARETGSTKK